MSNVLDFGKVDGIVVDKSDNTLVLLVIDQLPWDSARHEYEHLLLLEKKLNAYVVFIQKGLYKKTYPAREFEKFRIEVSLKNVCTSKGKEFFARASKKLEPLNIDLKYKQY